MPFKLSTVLIASFVIAAFVGGVIAWRFSFFFLPFSWTGEPARLAELLRVRLGGTVADIGAGDGAMAIEIARRVGCDGVVYATELSAQQRAVMAPRAAQANLPQGGFSRVQRTRRACLRHVATASIFARWPIT